MHPDALDGAALRRRRQELGLSLADVAERTKTATERAFGRVYLSQIERGLTLTLKRETRQRLATAYGYTSPEALPRLADTLHLVDLTPPPPVLCCPNCGKGLDLKLAAA